MQELRALLEDIAAQQKLSCTPSRATSAATLLLQPGANGAGGAGPTAAAVQNGMPHEQWRQQQQEKQQE